MTMENKSELKEYLKNVLKTAKKLGLNIQSGGGYTMGYDINNLPPYPVGLFGALSIVEGPGARCKLGLTFDQTQSLEAGFNGCEPNARNKKKKLRRNFQIDTELFKMGAELANTLYKPRKFAYEWDNSPWNKYKAADMPVVQVAANPNAINAPEPAAKAKIQKVGWTIGTVSATSATHPSWITYTSSDPVYLENNLEQKIAAKKKELDNMMIEAQPAPNMGEPLQDKIDKLHKLLSGPAGDLLEQNGGEAFEKLVKQAADVLQQKKFEAEEIKAAKAIFDLEGDEGSWAITLDGEV